MEYVAVFLLDKSGGKAVRGGEGLGENEDKD